MELNELDLKEKTASGPYADIYKHKNWAYKVFKEKRSKTEILYEALVNAQVEETGLPVPKVRDVTRLSNKQWVLATQFAEGETLLSLMQKNKKSLEEYIRLLIQLQIEINKKHCPKLVKTKDRLMSEISEAKEVDGNIKYELMTRLQGFSKQQMLVHGNFSPSNVIINKDGIPMIVDWIEASQGNPFYDIAKTYILLNLELKEVAKLYMDTYIQTTGSKIEQIQQWLPIVACAQLKYAQGDQKDLLMNWLNVVQYY